MWKQSSRQFLQKRKKKCHKIVFAFFLLCLLLLQLLLYFNHSFFLTAASAAAVIQYTQATSNHILQLLYYFFVKFLFLYVHFFLFPPQFPPFPCFSISMVLIRFHIVDNECFFHLLFIFVDTNVYLCMCSQYLCVCHYIVDDVCLH